MNLRRIILAIYLAFFVGLGAAAGLFFLDARSEYNRLKQTEAANRRRLAEAEVRLAEQKKILERLRNDPVYVEKMLRQKMGYAKPEEYIFRFEN